MENSKQRIEKILIYKGINAKQLSMMCGYDRPQVFYDILNEKTKNISQGLSIKIISAIPEISRTWLLTGEGSMLSEEIQEKSEKSDHAILLQNDELVKALQIHILDLQAERDRLYKEKEELKAEIDRLRQALGMEPIKKEKTA